MVKRSRSTRDRERKDRIKVDLDKIRTLLPTCATDKKMVIGFSFVCGRQNFFYLREHSMKSDVIRGTFKMRIVMFQ